MIQLGQSAAFLNIFLKMFYIKNFCFTSALVELFTPLLLFFLSGFFFTNTHDSQDSRGRGGFLFNSSLPLSPASKTLRYQLGDYCRELTSAQSQQPDSNREPLVSERKSLTTKSLTTNPSLLFSNKTSFISKVLIKIVEAERMLFVFRN